ncbi:MAG: purine-nucleoside phosphorylase [Planctomycetes bacterium]|nr:purine-nucleoside phosphorylase [Planctomycetota bacterium]
MVSPSDTPLRRRALAAAEELLDRLGGVRPRVAMLLGTGHSSISNQLKKRTVLQRPDLPRGLVLAEESHLVAGELDGVPILVGDPPLAPHDGHGPFEMTFPIRVLRAMGAELLILTAGAASLSRQLEPGSIAVVEDHLNFANVQPLQGPHDAELGPRFPDMSNPYPVRWRKLARDVANEIGINCLEGVFAAVPGPSLPTRAEYRFLRRAGADLVGMSLVPEVIAAVHSGLDVLALVGVTQFVQVESAIPVAIEEMLDAADLAAPRMASMLAGIVARMSS